MQFGNRDEKKQHSILIYANIYMESEFIDLLKNFPIKCLFFPAFDRAHFFFFLLLTFNANIIHSLKNHLSSLLHLTIVSRSNDNVTFR